MAPWAKCLLHKREELSSNPQQLCKNASHDCAPAAPARKQRQTDSEDCWPVTLAEMGSSRSSE